jgi:hypothetical protein
MDRKHILLAAALLLVLIPPPSSAFGPGQNPNANQVRVIAERASIYIEPSRGSTRIDIVGKGALLNLLQTKKVNDIWYHVSFSSSRYGTRISGFILDSTVELVGETSPPPLKEKKPQEEVVAPPAVPPKAEEKEMPKPEPPPPPEFEITLMQTALPENRPIDLPPKPATLRELPWKGKETVPAEKEKMAVEVEESALLTSLPIPREVVLPSGEKPLLDSPWRVVAPPAVEIPKEPETAKVLPQPEATPPPPAPKKKEAEAAKPEPEPAKPQTIKPPRSPVPGKGPGRISLNLGYGSSFGGAGACVQVNAGRRIALHAGAGIFPAALIYSETDWVKNKPLWSVGIKYFLPFASPPFYPYVDIQYGGLRVEAAQVVIGIWDYDYVYSREQKTLWGPSLLGGVEIRKGRFGFCGALGFSYVTTSWEMLQNRVSLSFDLSLAVHF